MTYMDKVREKIQNSNPLALACLLRAREREITARDYLMNETEPTQQQKIWIMEYIYGNGIESLRGTDMAMYTTLSIRIAKFLSTKNWNYNELIKTLDSQRK